MQKSKSAFQFVLLFLVILLFQGSAGALDEKSATEEEVELPEGGGDPGKAYLKAFAKVFSVAVNDKDPGDLPHRSDTKALYDDMHMGIFYRSPVISGGRRRGSNAFLHVNAQSEHNEPLKGTVAMAYDGKQWIYQSSQWEPTPRMIKKETMNAMYELGRALLSFAAENNDVYPQARTMEQLANLLEPDHMSRMPRKDGWNRDFIYLVNARGDEFWLISYGSDGKPEEGIYDDKGLPIIKQEVKTTHEGADFIVGGQMALFLRYPKT